MSKFNGMRWLEERKTYLTLDWKPYAKSPCIFSASPPLLKECEYAYVPRIVSIGPYHFGKKELREMETFKGDAARREVFRIRKVTNNSQFKFEHVIDKIRSREEEIKRCYDKGTPFNGEVLLWMVGGDACFILEFFRNHLCRLHDDDGGDGESFQDDCGLAPKFHPIFGTETENPGVKSEIMKDLIKLDNQIPLFVLEDVLDMEMRDSRAELDKLLRKVFNKFYYRPFEFCAKGASRKRSHILDIYHHTCLGVVAPENEKEVKLNVQCSPLGCALQQYENLPIHIGRERWEEWCLKIPSAVQLRNGGVKFQANGKTLDDIRYEGKTLTLVRLKLDVDLEVYIRNLIALEICSPDSEIKGMSAYCQFMYELCQTVKGVEVMRKKGVIIGNLWDSKRVSQLLSVSNLTISQPARKSIKETRAKLSSCYKTQRSILLTTLWNEFLKAYGSKPWMLVGGFGAFIVLFLTAIQGFCLFKDCEA
ncbi:UPF0481 protein At3g47200-like [Cryptomeria japonica]|uniref:UPF0481 protein At3g47200-like n=1 Tax=Cryptomeria japonica TaxID=3369 RepID=UPI0025ABC094|nr:UPF0481 protein At3g47200-like [Cryptomeria japonica]